MIWTMCLTPLSLLRTLSWSLGILGHCVALYSVLHVLSFGSVAACVLRDPVFLGSALYEGYRTTFYRSAVCCFQLLLYIKRGESLF